jgi:hypothetical protein
MALYYIYSFIFSLKMDFKSRKLFKMIIKVALDYLFLFNFWIITGEFCSRVCGNFDKKNGVFKF